MKSKSFSISERIKSFRYAWRGIVRLVRYEHNARIHLTIALIAILLGFIFNIGALEWLSIALSIGLVFAAELFNSAIEKICDLITLEKHPQIKLIKDYSAGAVLVLAISAVVVGLIIFIPKVIILF
ncbi:MAG: diacylglycerol kinase family protein [Bacteroidales bacterium]|nr:diacylglycerol kinase family protein [Bacteroidales bacterium]